MKKIITYLICLYIFILPIFPSKFKYKFIPLNGDVLLAIVILFYFILIIFNRNSRKRLVKGLKDFFTDYLNIFMFLWVIMMFVSVIYATDRTLAIKESIRASTYLILFFIIKYEIHSKKMLDKILKSVILLSGIVGVIGIFQYFTGVGIKHVGEYSTVVRVSSTLENSNNLGAFFIFLVFPLTILTIKEKCKIKKIYYCMITIISFINIIICFSRNAWIGLIIGYLCLIFIYNYKFIYGAIIVGGVALCIPTISSRLKEIGDMSQNVSRISLWKIALEMIKDQPILGVGNGNYRTLYSKYYKYVKDLGYTAHAKFHPHNIFLKIQCELGIIGLIGFIGFISSLIYRINKFSNKVKNYFYSSFYKGFLASIISFLFMNLIDNFFSAPKVIAFFWILIAVFSSYEYNIGYKK